MALPTRLVALLLLAGCTGAPAGPVAPTAEDGPWPAKLDLDLTLHWPRSGAAVTDEGSSCAALGSGRLLRVWNVTATLRWEARSQDAQRLLFALENYAGRELDEEKGPSPLALSVDNETVWPREHLSLYAIPESYDTAVVVDQPLSLHLELLWRGASQPQLGTLQECTL